LNTLAVPLVNPPEPGGLVPPKRFARVEETQAYLKSQGVRYVLAQFVDIHGVAKAKSVPVDHLSTIMTDGAGARGRAWSHGVLRGAANGTATLFESAPVAGRCPRRSKTG